MPQRSREIVKFVLPVGLNNGKVRFDLTEVNEKFGYEPFFELEENSCGEIN